MQPRLGLHQKGRHHHPAVQHRGAGDADLRLELPGGRDSGLLHPGLHRRPLRLSAGAHRGRPQLAAGRRRRHRLHRQGERGGHPGRLLRGSGEPD